jgi:DNA adenine methylase
MKQLHLFDTPTTPTEHAHDQVINVASVPQRSPFRYPGGKTWAIPVVRKWLTQEKKTVDLLIEPFAGGGIVGLTAVAENLANQVELIELDPEVAAVWLTVTGPDNEWLANRIASFAFSADTVKAELSREPANTREVAFCTILKNRVNHGGILAKGSGMLKAGENGKGIASRWYPTTLANRIRAINMNKHKLTAIEGDAFAVLHQHQDNPLAYFFIDPPYVGAGRRLYTHFDIDHARLFEVTASLKGHFLLTYDDAAEIRALADRYGLAYTTVPMKTTHHLEKRELLISDNFNWLNTNPSQAENGTSIKQYPAASAFGV